MPLSGERNRERRRVDRRFRSVIGCVGVNGQRRDHMFKIKKGLNLPIAGSPAQQIDDSKTVRSVAILGDDYPGMKPTMAVAEGESVAQGQILFSDKKTAGVVFTSPVAGTVASINRGAKRAFISVVIDVAGDEAESFQSYEAAALTTLDRQTVISQMLQSGAWTALRTRPFSRIPAPESTPNSIFVTAMDSNPLAADPKPIIAAREAEFSAGLTVLGRLTDGAVHLCQDGSAALKASDQAGISNHVFEGPHPAGLPGTHIHFIDPVSPSRTVWFIGYQDVIALGHLFLQGSVLSADFYNSGSIAPLSDQAIVDLEMKLLSEAYAEFKDAKVVDSCVKRYQGAVSWFSPGSFAKRPPLATSVKNVCCAGDWVRMGDRAFRVTRSRSRHPPCEGDNLDGQSLC